MEQYNNQSKKVVIDAQNGLGDTFTCIEREIGIQPDGITPIVEYITIETEPDSEQHISVCIFSDQKELVENITWYTWIMSGIKNKQISELIK